MTSPITPSGFRSQLTLILCVVLHAFTHAYATMLVPLYLLMVADLHLSGVKRASLLVSLYALVYNFGSYAAGILSDRFNRKLLLGAGLLLNAVAITLIGLTRRYDLLLLWAVIAGIGGTIFHPAAGALVPAHFPKSPGMAIGLLGIGEALRMPVDIFPRMDIPVVSVVWTYAGRNLFVNAGLPALAALCVLKPMRERYLAAAEPRRPKN